MRSFEYDDRCGNLRLVSVTIGDIFVESAEDGDGGDMIAAICSRGKEMVDSSEQGNATSNMNDKVWKVGNDSNYLKLALRP